VAVPRSEAGDAALSKRARTLTENRSIGGRTEPRSRRERSLEIGREVLGSRPPQATESDGERADLVIAWKKCALGIGREPTPLV
jgi:hypothetical protein